jgi:cell division protein FtsI (penicillin-binding protein 3)
VLGRTDSARRLLVLLICFGIAGSGLLVRLGYWQIAQRDRLLDAAHRQIYLRTEVPSRRGEIYDRSGTVVLASSVIHDRLIVTAQHLSDADQATMVAFLAERLGLDPLASDDLRAKLATGKPYIVVDRDVSAEQAESIRADAAAAGILGITFETEAVREYPQAGGGPNSSLAAHLLGFVNREGQGQYGIEQYYQAQLAGQPQIVESDKDANGQPLVDTEHVIEAGAPGQDLRLTIDAGLQLAMEQEVMAADIADHADSVSAIVMDPYTGEIYGEATYPSFDGNDYSATASDDPGRFVDPVVSAVYEPGSVFKMLTVLTALQLQTTTLQTTFKDTGSLKLDNGKTKIEDSDRKAMGVMKLEDAIAYSRNVVAARVALGLAPTVQEASEQLHAVWIRMGFGSRTGVDLAGEVGGLVNDPSISAWRQIDLANGSFGQGVAVTPMQLATAYAAMVNGGTLVQPHVVAAIGSQIVAAPSRGSVLDASLSPVLANLLHHVMTIPWYKPFATVPGYWLGAKTGTAQIWDAKQHRWLPNTYNFSAIGFIGRTEGHPDLIVAVQIHSGRPGRNAQTQIIVPVASTELFRRIATDAITTSGLLPALPAAPAEDTSSVVVPVGPADR